MVILHGENTVQSRNALSALLDKARSEQKQIIRLEAKKLESQNLIEELGASSLFGEPRVILIEELHSLPTSARKTQLIKQIGGLSADDAEVILWEKRQLTPTMLKQFPQARNQEFKLTKYLFNWLDTINGQNKLNQKMFDSAIEQDGEMMLFTMLIRQIRLLIQVKEGKTASLAPFMVGKLKKQSETFSLPQLLQLHHKLLLLDLAQKTSASVLTLQQELELLLVGM